MISDGLLISLNFLFPSNDFEVYNKILVSTCHAARSAQCKKSRAGALCSFSLRLSRSSLPNAVTPKPRYMFSKQLLLRKHVQITF